MIAQSTAAEPAAAVRGLKGDLHVQDLRDGARLLGRVLAALPAGARIRAAHPPQVQVRPLQRLVRIQGRRGLQSRAVGQSESAVTPAKLWIGAILK